MYLTILLVVWKNKFADISFDCLKRNVTVPPWLDIATFLLVVCTTSGIIGHHCYILQVHNETWLQIISKVLCQNVYFRKQEFFKILTDFFKKCFSSCFLA